MFTVAFNVNVLMLLLMLIPVGYLVMLFSVSFTVIIQVDYFVLENCVFFLHNVFYLAIYIQSGPKKPDCFSDVITFTEC